MWAGPMSYYRQIFKKLDFALENIEKLNIHSAQK